MRIPRFSALLVTAALTGAPSFAALAKPATTAHSRSARTSAPKPSTDPLAPAAASDEERYAEREAKDKSVAEFKGGDSVVVIGAGTVVVVLLIVLLVVLL